jgi:2-amino-4-hydroxy-6-hydroxymethyldihydropteridine diphosphokinase
MQTVQTILALGSNIEPRRAYIQRTVEALQQLPGLFQLKCSSLHETEPVNVPERDQHLLFLNAIVVCETSLSPESLSEAIHKIEALLGRQHSSQYGAARTIDIDIIAIGDTIINTPTLTLPHPRAHQRTFVLAPLAELLPDFILPGQQLTVSDMLKNLSVKK